MDSRPKVYDMYDNDCLDYGPYTPSENTPSENTASECSVGMQDEMPMEEFIVLDETGDSEEETNRPPSGTGGQRQVVDVGMYSQLTAGCSEPGVNRSASGTVSGPSGDVEPEKKKVRVRSCPVCHEDVDRPRRHVLRTHLPWYWLPTTACWQCRKQEAQRGKNAINHTLHHDGGFTDAQLHEWCQLLNGALYLLAAWLECDTLDDLLRHVKDHKLHLASRSAFSKDDLPLMHFYAEHYSDHQPREFQVKPPNHVICLINWELASCLLNRVGSQRFRRFRKSSRRLTSTGLNVPEMEPETEAPPLFLVDTHFHLDILPEKGKFEDFRHLERIVTQFNSITSLHLGVANYVFPRNWNNWQKEVSYHPNLSCTFGIHPHIAAGGVDRSQFDQLRQLLESPRCVTMGEIGLDFTTRCHCEPCGDPQRCQTRIKRNQEEALITMLRQAREFQKPVVLHCRDNGTGQAAKRTLQIIYEIGAAHLKFHRHTFIGTFEELEEWRKLNRISFGVSWKTLEETPDCVARMESGEILLETDAPYLSPFPECKINHPWNLDIIAERVAQLRNTPVSILIETANRNAIDFYGLRHH